MVSKQDRRAANQREKRSTDDGRVLQYWYQQRYRAKQRALAHGCSPDAFPPLRDFKPKRTKEEKRARFQRWQEANRDRTKASRKRFLKRHPNYKREQRQRVRELGIKAYGSRCVCCGETHQQFLTIDHVNGRCEHDFRSSGMRITGLHMWIKLKKLGWPKVGYQLLCFNCNCAKGAFGVCPHQETAAP